jgi:DNA polymerase III subunit delta
VSSKQLRAAGVAEGTLAVLVKGGDAPLVRDLVVELLGVLVGSGDPGLCVEDLDIANLITENGDVDLGRVVDAAHTPPFLTDRRVVVARGLGVLTKKDDVAPLVSYLSDPSPTTSLVLVWDKPSDARLAQRKTGPAPKALLTAVAAAGAVLDADPGSKPKDVGAWIQAQLADVGLKLEAAAQTKLVDWIGEGRDRLPGLVTTLAGAHGPGATLGVTDIEPYLGSDEGGVPPWDLTDAIDAGDVAGAVDTLHRMLRGGGRHPLQVMAILHGHVGRMLALDGADVTGRDDAARLIGAGPFQAEKALMQGRRLGHDRIVELVQLLASADLDLRGGTALHSVSEETSVIVIEVLVARMASRSAVAGARNPSGPGRGSRAVAGTGAGRRR